MKTRGEVGIEKIYLDFASATPVSKEAKEAMKKMENIFVNSASLYKRGVEAKKILEKSRKSIADILRGKTEEIIFTSGGTEGNNMAIIGLHNFLIKEYSNNKLHIVTSTIEHSSVLEPIRELESRGVQVTYVKPNNEGIIDPIEIKKVLKKETFLVSIMYANNEIGTVQPIREIAKVIRNHNKHREDTTSKRITHFHTDACQAANYLSLDTAYLGVDFMTLDSGKVYGPKGVGFLYMKKGVEISPIFFGGGQEGALRSGTEDVSRIVGFTASLNRTILLQESESKRLVKLQDYFIKKILDKIPNSSINGSLISRLPNNINICIKNLNAELAVFELDEIGVECSTTSTCQNIKGDPYSYVIEEIGNHSCIASSLRFTMGRTTTKKQLDYCLKHLIHISLNQWNISLNNKSFS